MYQELIFELKVLIYNYAKDNLNAENQIAICEALAALDSENSTLQELANILSDLDKMYGDEPKNIIYLKL